MKRTSERPRRVVPQPLLPVLRLFGWRYSLGRSAWVHRAFRGRYGPVFVTKRSTRLPVTVDIDLTVLEAEQPGDRLARPVLRDEPFEHERHEPPTELALEADDGRWAHIRVDGRPPRFDVGPATPPGPDPIPGAEPTDRLPRREHRLDGERRVAVPAGAGTWVQRTPMAVRGEAWGA